MKLFLDTAHLDSIKKWLDTGLIDGITTNPSNLSKEKGNPLETVKEICRLLPHGHISVEITQEDPKEVYKQAQQISKIAPNVWVKIPCYAPYYSIIKKLVDEKVNINITLVFSTLQSLMMAKLGVYYISPFIGRLDDVDADGAATLEEMRHLYDLYGFQTKILAASIRSVHDFHQAVTIGADAVTMPLEVFEKAIVHPLTDQGIEKFKKDWQKLNISVFP
jgi:transaldolase